MASFKDFGDFESYTFLETSSNHKSENARFQIFWRRTAAILDFEKCDVQTMKDDQIVRLTWAEFLL